MVMQVELGGFQVCKEKGGGTSEWLLYAAVNTANKRSDSSSTAQKILTHFGLVHFFFFLF